MIIWITLLPVEINPAVWVILGFFLLVYILFIYTFKKRFRIAAPDQLLVIYGKLVEGSGVKILHGGGQFVPPLVQDSDYLELTPVTLKYPIEFADGSQSKSPYEVEVITGISTNPGVYMNAAQRLLGLRKKQIRDIISDIVKGQLRVELSKLESTSKPTELTEFKRDLHSSITTELQKVGVEVFEVNLINELIFKQV